MTSIKSYKDLVVWARAMDLAEGVNALVRSFPKQEEYRMAAQLARSSVSIPANIAEGFVRGTRKDYGHFISIARGSAAETETLLLLSARLALAPASRIDPLLAVTDETARMLTALRNRLVPKPKT